MNKLKRWLLIRLLKSRVETYEVSFKITNELKASMEKKSYKKLIETQKISAIHKLAEKLFDDGIIRIKNIINNECLTEDFYCYISQVIK